MEAKYSSEMLVDFKQTTWRYILKDRTLRNHRCENLKCYMVVTQVYEYKYLHEYLVRGSEVTLFTLQIGWFHSKCERRQSKGRIPFQKKFIPLSLFLLHYENQKFNRDKGMWKLPPLNLCCPSGHSSLCRMRYLGFIQAFL
jgi:hypothetical protein